MCASKCEMIKNYFDYMGMFKLMIIDSSIDIIFLIQSVYFLKFSKISFITGKIKDVLWNFIEKLKKKFLFSNFALIL